MRGRDLGPAEAYASASAGLSAGSGWLLPIRSEAAALLQSRGFPARDEAWKYTRAGNLLQAVFVPAQEASDVALPDGPWGDEPRLVFVDGIPHPGLSRGVEGLQLEDLSTVSGGCPELGRALGEGDGFSALNRAFLRHGAVLRLPRGQQLSALHLIHLCTGSRAPSGEGHLETLRHVLVLEGDGQLQLFEHYLSADGVEHASLTNAATEVILGPDSHVRHVRILDEDLRSLHVGAIGAVVGAGSRYDLTSVVLGVGLARIEVTVHLGAKGSATDLSGLSLLQGRQHVDHHVTVEHATPGGISDQDFRSVLGDQSRSVYTGAVIVRRGAIGTRSSQLHRALLLSDDAIANTRPWLEIDNDDVSCTHGAAIGSLDEDALFYLRQRGLSELAARGLLTSGFASQILSRLSPEAVAQHLLQRARAWLGAS
ncbi:MAG TPA: Fe-S cluster assembly protein SufD [Deltaproteobacteria bacterium]|nr:Fe-S cluster assembly protein SufD [Deltaproteobacteria bacterium]